MNGVTIPASVTERVRARRGTEHPFWDLRPARTALVVVDLQNGVMDDAVGHAVCPAAREVVPAVNRLAAGVRAAGGGVFWVADTFDPGWTVLGEMCTPERRRAREEGTREGSVGHRFWHDLDVRSEDEVVRKYRYSAFLPGSSALPDRLRVRGLDTVLICGALTDVACESSARDAMMRNFRVVMVSDANAAMTREEHDASLTALYLAFADVMDADTVLARLEGGMARAA